MDTARSRGRVSGRGSAHARGGRGRGGRGKAARARGAPTRGMRVPPEYLQRVIAERQGLDPSALPDEDEDEDEAEERYRPRELETNAGRYREVDDGNLVEDDEELAKETARVLENIRLRDLSGPQSLESPGGQSVSTSAVTSNVKTSLRNGIGRPPDGSDHDDVDHALGAHLVALRGKQAREGQKGKGQVITVEWDDRMQAMSKEKAEAEAYAALKARFRGQPTGLAPAPGLKPKNVDPFGRQPRSSGTAGDTGNAGDSEEKLDKLEDFLDDLLG